MNPNDVAPMVMGLVIVGIPVLGFTAKMVLKPLVEALVRLREAGVVMGSQQQQLADQKFVQMQEEIRLLHEQVERLTEAETFHRQLGAGRES